LPSGDGCGFCTSSQSRYCSNAMRFWGGRCWATIGVVATTAKDSVARAILQARSCMGVPPAGRSTCILGGCHPDGKGSRLQCMTRFSTLAIIAVAGISVRLGAQQVRGVVRDSALAVPLPGAVVTLLDSTGTSVSRVISDASGSFVLNGT